MKEYRGTYCKKSVIIEVNLDDVLLTSHEPLSLFGMDSLASGLEQKIGAFCLIKRFVCALR